MKLTTIERYIKSQPEYNPEVMETFVDHNILTIFFNYDIAYTDKKKHLQMERIQEKAKHICNVFPLRLSINAFPYPHSTLYYDVFCL